MVISEKNFLKTDFEGKNSCKEIPGEKIPTLKNWRIMPEKNSLAVACQEKIFFHHTCLGKKFLHKQNHPYTPKIQMVGCLEPKRLY